MTSTAPGVGWPGPEPGFGPGTGEDGAGEDRAGEHRADEHRADGGGAAEAGLGWPIPAQAGAPAERRPAEPAPRARPGLAAGAGADVSRETGWPGGVPVGRRAGRGGPAIESGQEQTGW